uniref:Uncharacterized protein n=1 Tax=Anguilla anguilla TaxID=7936 RepID=A0A0E9SKX5_ANGAN
MFHVHIFIIIGKGFFTWLPYHNSDTDRAFHKPDFLQILLDFKASLQ